MSIDLQQNTVDMMPEREAKSVSENTVPAADMGMCTPPAPNCPPNAAMRSDAKSSMNCAAMQSNELR